MMSQDFRADFLGSFRTVPAPIAIVAVRAQGMRRGLTVTAWSSLSADPPTVLACVNRASAAHELILSARAFSLNVLSRDHGGLVRVFSGQGGLQGEQRFAAADWSETPAGQPALNGALVTYDCAVEEVLDYSSHSIFIGRVRHLAHQEKSALLYLQGEVADAARLCR